MNPQVQIIAMGLHSQYPQFTKNIIFPKEQRRDLGGGKDIIPSDTVYWQSVGELPSEPRSVTAQLLHVAEALYLRWPKLRGSQPVLPGLANRLTAPHASEDIKTAQVTQKEKFCFKTLSQIFFFYE